MPSLVLLDLHLGNASGAELITALKREFALSGVPIIAFTDYPDLGSDLSGLEDLIVKPAREDDFKRCFEHLLIDWREGKRFDIAGASASYKGCSSV